VRNKNGEKEYYSVFGQYILTPEVFSQLHEDIMQKEIEGDHVTEIELTSALEAVRKRSGMMGVRLQGRMFDMGNPTALVRAIEEYSR
jgi:UTP-glucose-1-phosphate uridylyltransferase